jgi:hypothetical protein
MVCLLAQRKEKACKYYMTSGVSTIGCVMHGLFAYGIKLMKVPDFGTS